MCGHKKKEGLKNPDMKKNFEQAPSVGEHGPEGWLVGSGARSHLFHVQDNFVEIRRINRSVDILITIGDTLLTAGVGTTLFVLNSKLDRRLSLKKFALSAYRVTRDHFCNKTCEIRNC